VFGPLRQEATDLLASELKSRELFEKSALDVGTGTGVLAFLLARRGARVVATDLESRAVACASENASRLGLKELVRILEADLFPPEECKFDLVVSNPPWLPSPALSSLEKAVYDPGEAFLARLVLGLPAHLSPGGEALIVLSDLAERLGLRPRGHVESLAARSGLVAAPLAELTPKHPRSRDVGDPLHAIRSGERVVLYRLSAG
jgi:methylase of polypeptide subunit release factors